MNFKNRIILAPMAAVSDIAFRKLCTDHGADIVYSQMIDSNAFIRENKKLADFYDEKNVVAQFLGNDPLILGKCAKAVEKQVQAVDLNLGCPHSDVVKRECGSYLMKYPDRIASIVRELVKSVDLPVTVKMRAGYDKTSINAVEIAKICEKEGVSAIAVHGRPRAINYQTPVDYNIIKQVKDAVNVPVIANGDIFSGEDAKKMFEKTGCDSVMIGRAAIRDPSIFQKIKDFLKGKKSEDISKNKLFKEYLIYCKKYDIQFESIKKHAQWLIKGVPCGAKYREMINRAKTVEELKQIYSLFE